MEGRRASIKSTQGSDNDRLAPRTPKVKAAKRKQARTKGDYVVGYGKPPKEHQFKPKQSGNLSGKRKGTKNFRTRLREALEKSLDVVENGERKSVSKYDLAISQAVNQACTGNYKFAVLILSMARELDQLDDHSDDAALNGFEEELLDLFAERRLTRRSRKGGQSQ